MLAIQQLCVSYGSKQVLKDISCHVDPGGVVVLCGRNGSGKSTLLRELSGSARTSVSTGTVTKEGSVAFCPDSFLSLPDLSSRENIELVLLAQGLGPTERENRRSTLLGAVDLHSDETLPVRSLSFGQRRRVDLAITVAKNAALCLFDEPFRGLDVGWIDSFLSITRLLSRAGRLVVVATHALTVVSEVATAYWVLQNGRLYEQGPGGFAASSLRDGWQGLDPSTTVELPWLFSQSLRD